MRPTESSAKAAMAAKTAMCRAAFASLALMYPA